MSKHKFQKQQNTPPAAPETGAAFILAATVQLYDRKDGTGADWQAMAEALFRAAFNALDKLPPDACRSVARRVHEGSYSRTVDHPKVASDPVPGKVASPPGRAPVPVLDGPA